MKHVYHTTKIRLSIIPPRVERVNDQIVFDINAFVFSQLFKFHTVKERFINTIGDSTAKSGSVVVFFDLPNSNWINC